MLQSICAATVFSEPSHLSVKVMGPFLVGACVVRPRVEREAPSATARSRRVFSMSFEPCLRYGTERCKSALRSRPLKEPRSVAGYTIDTGSGKVAASSSVGCMVKS